MCVPPRGQCVFSSLDGSYTVNVNRPQYPYDVELHAPICITQASDGAYPDSSFFDPLDPTNTYHGGYDYRILVTSTWLMPSTQKAALNTFLRSVLGGRAQNFILSLGDNHTGFYPFGVDMGDYGDYIVRILSQDQGGVLASPFRWFEDQFAMVLVTPPSAPANILAQAQGALSIGSYATGLMYPQDGFKAKSIYDIQTDISISGKPYSIDSPIISDSWETEFQLDLNSGNMQNLIYQLFSVTRTADVNIVAPSGFWPYGADQGAGGTYQCKFLGSEHTDKEVILKMSNIGFNQWQIPLNFYLKDKIA